MGFFAPFWVLFLKKYTNFYVLKKTRFPTSFEICSTSDAKNLHVASHQCSPKSICGDFENFHFSPRGCSVFAPFWPFLLILSINWAAAPRKMKIFKIAARSLWRTLMGCPIPIFSIRSWVDLKWSEETRFCQNVKNYVFFKKSTQNGAKKAKFLRYFIFQIIFSNKSLKSSILPIFLQFESFLAKLEPF